MLFSVLSLCMLFECHAETHHSDYIQSDDLKIAPQFVSQTFSKLPQSLILAEAPKISIDSATEDARTESVEPPNVPESTVWKSDVWKPDVWKPDVSVSTSNVPELNVPAGFEFLLEPQTTVVDVYYGGQYLASTLATYSPGEIRFDHPERIIALVPNLLDRNKIVEILNSPLPSNEGLSCGKSYRKNCGLLPKTLTGVIFDENQYRADLFIAEKELSTQRLNVAKFLPESDAGFSFIHGMSAAFSDIDTGVTDYSVNNSTLIGFGESRLRMFSNLSRRDDLVFDSIAYENDFEGKSRQIGLLKTDNLNSEFLPALQIIGARFASTLDTRNDLDLSEGSPLSIFLTNRSRVEILKDDRLINTHVYAAGNQMLDTRLLPSGAYDITIRVLEGGTVVSEETRFYRKSNQIPPVDQDIYFLELGKLTDDSDTHTIAKTRDNWLLRGSYASRLKDYLGIQGAVASTDTDRLLEGGLYFLGKNVTSNVSLAHTSNGDSAYYFSVGAKLAKLYLNARYRQLDVADHGEILPDDVFLLGDESSIQSSFNLTHGLGPGRLSFESRLNKRGEESVVSHILGFNFPIFKFSNESYALTDISISKQEGNWQALIRLSVNFRTNHWQYRASQSRLEEKFNDRKSADDISQMSVNWNDRDVLASNLDVGMNALRSDDVDSLDVGVKWESRYAQVQGSVDRQTIDGEESTTYSGGFATTIIGDAEGIAMGGREINQSAVIVELDSEKYDTNFNILVDNSKRNYVKPGTVSVVNLKPFETYRIKVQDIGKELLSYEQKEEQVTLYPGNVKRIKWRVSKIDVVFGRIMDSHGSPLKNALIEGVEGLAVTDEFGIFQAELKQGVKQLHAKTLTQKCEIVVPEYTTVNQIARLGTLTCRLPTLSPSR